MLDVIYLATVIALFAVVGMIAKGAEKIGQSNRSSSRRDAADGAGRR